MPKRGVARCADPSAYIIPSSCKRAVLARCACTGSGRTTSDVACSASMEADRRAVHLGSSGTAAPSHGATGGRGGLPAATADGLAAAAVVGRVGPCDAATPARHGGALAAHACAGLWHLRHADVRCVWTWWRARPARGWGGGRRVLVQCHRDHGQHGGGDPPTRGADQAVLPQGGEWRPASNRGGGWIEPTPRVE